MKPDFWLLTFDFLLQTQKAFYKIHMWFCNGSIHSHVTFTFFGFLRQDVTFESFLMHDLSRAGNFKTFFGTGVCFYFRHFTQYLNFTLEVFLHRQNPCWTSSAILYPLQKAKDCCWRTTVFWTGCKDRVEMLTGKSETKKKRESWLNSRF